MHICVSGPSSLTTWFVSVVVCVCVCVCVQDLRERFQGVSLAAAEAAYFSGQEAQGGVLAHLAAKLAAKLKVRVAVGSGEWVQPKP